MSSQDPASTTSGDKPSFYQRAKQEIFDVLAFEPLRDFGRGSKEVATAYFGTTSKYKWIFLMVCVAAVFTGAIWFGWQYVKSGSGAAAAVKVSGKVAKEFAPAPLLFSSPSVPVPFQDSTGETHIVEMPLLSPEEVQMTASVGGEDTPSLVFRHRDLWFDEFRSPESESYVEAICPPGSAPSCSSMPVSVVVPPRPLFEFDPRFVVGVQSTFGGLSSGATSPLDNTRFYAGADLLRVGPAHFQLGASLDPDSLSGMSVDFAPGVAFKATDNIMITGHRLWYEEQWSYGVAIKF